jgi:hypothetical protein
VKLYRIVHDDPPSLADLKSDRDRGRPRPVNDAMVRLWEGFSAFDSEERARIKARTYPVMGGYIAELDIPEGSSIRFEQTTKARGHYTIWGDPDAVGRCVIAVLAV